jgi:hypothetical protein
MMPWPALLALWALLILAGCGLAGGEDEPVESDSALVDLSGLGDLKDHFNQDAGMPRILILLSPSCPECLLGASRVQQVVLEENPGVMPDPRALHYWDGEKAVGTWLAQQDRYWQLFRGPSAWDIYYVFGPDAVWGEAPGPLLDSGYPLVQKTKG